MQGVPRVPKVRWGAESAMGCRECDGVPRVRWSAARARVLRVGSADAPQTRMAGVRRVEDFVAWQLCMELDDVVFEITATGAVARDFDFCNQIRESAGGPAANIAEGYRRFGPKEFAKYLRIALGSLSETATHLERGRRKKYFTDEDFARALSLCRRAGYMTNRLLQSKLRQIAAMEAEKRQNAASRRRRRRPHP